MTAKQLVQKIFSDWERHNNPLTPIERIAVIRAYRKGERNPLISVIRWNHRIGPLVFKYGNPRDLYYRDHLGEPCTRMGNKIVEKL